MNERKKLAAAGGALLLASAFVALRSAPAEDSPKSASPNAGPCSCAWYTTVKCECSPETKCGCEKCAKDTSCPCLAEFRKGTGMIRGTVKSPFIRLAQAVVYIAEMPGKTFTLPQNNPVMDQKDLIFTPHVLPVLVGSTVDFPNSDKVRHNVFSTPKSVNVFNLGQYPAGDIKHVKFDKIGVASLLCNVHAEMSAYVLVCQNPYFSVTDKKDGSFLIPNVPPGQWELTLFHQKFKPKTLPVTVEAGKEAAVEFRDLR